MGPKPTRTLSIVVGALAVFGSVCPSAAQNFAPDPLSIRMPDDATDANVERIAGIASRLGVPFGFETVDALAEQVSAQRLHRRKGSVIRRAELDELRDASRFVIAERRARDESAHAVSDDGHVLMTVRSDARGQ